MADYDCLLIGHNELDFEQYFGILDNMASSGGRDHVAFTDLQLNHVKYDGRPHQALDLLTCLYNEDRAADRHREFYNGDCLWTAIAYLGSYLAQRGYTFDFVNLFHREKEALAHKLKANRYQLVVLTGTMYVFEQNIWEVVTFIRRHCPEARIIAGGPYISKQAEEREPEYMKPLFRYLNADFYCYAREGEQTLVALLDALKGGEDIASIPNLAYKSGNDYEITAKRRETNPLAENLIDYSLFADSYRGSGWANVRISDGCPYACGFCAFPEHGNERYVLMTLDRIEREFDSIRESGSISHIFFVDATLNVPRRQFKEMLRMMIRKQYGFKWHCFFRCDQTDEETIWLMRDAGCIGVFLGLESANATVLRNMDKTAHKEDFYRTLPWFKAAGLRQMVSVLVGFPGETIATFRETLEFIEEVQPDFTRIQTWYCDPTTPVWFKRDHFGLQGKGYGWSHDTMDSETAVELVVDAIMSLRGVTQVPDPGYNWVACYAMDKLGMSMEQQKAFLRLFIAASKRNLLNTAPVELEALQLETLRAAAKFDEPAELDEAAFEELSGERYVAARAFWVEEFRGTVPAADGREGANGASGGDRMPTVHWSDSLDGRVASDSDSADDDASWVTILAAYSWVVGQMGEPGGAMLVAPEDGGSFPLRLRPPSDAGLDAHRLETRQVVRLSREHHQFGWFVLTHGLTAKEFDVRCPELRAAFLADGPEADEESLKRRWRDHHAIRNQIDVILTLTDDGDGSRIELSCGTGRLDADGIAALGQDLLDTLGAQERPAAVSSRLAGHESGAGGAWNPH